MQRKDFMIPLRSFLEIVTGSGIVPALGDLGFLARLPSFSAAKVALEPRMGRFHPEIEPRVRLIEEMSRNRFRINHRRKSNFVNPDRLRYFSYLGKTNIVTQVS